MPLGCDHLLLRHRHCINECLHRCFAEAPSKPSRCSTTFCHANDPHEEHDFGAFDVDGHTIMFKIDYLDRDLSMHSPDPADPAVTQRVITIMLAEEY
jgi:hypothetical protein